MQLTFAGPGWNTCAGEAISLLHRASHGLVISVASTVGLLQQQHIEFHVFIGTLHLSVRNNIIILELASVHLDRCHHMQARKQDIYIHICIEHSLMRAS